MKYFTFEQFSHSDTAKRKNIDNSVPPGLKPHAEELINFILDPLRDAWGSDIYLTSAYRGYALNKAVGGSTTSAHSYAYAADLVPKNGKTLEFKEFAMKWLLNNGVNFVQNSLTTIFSMHFPHSSGFKFFKLFSIYILLKEIFTLFT